MIIEKETKRSTFLDYMLYQEKDEAPRRNMKVINVRVSDKRRQDYTKGAEIEDEEELDEPITDAEDNTNEPEPTETDVDTEEPATDEPVTDNEDYTGGAETDAGTEETVDAAPEENGSPPPEGETETVDAEPAEETDGEAGTEGDGTDEPVIDDEDYTGGAETDDIGEETDSETDTGTEEPAEGDTTETDGNTDENSVEQLYKYNLYKKFKKVLKTIEDYSDELENITSDDIETNAKYKQLTTKLKDIEDLMKDYMIMKFSKVSFMQSMLFYQRVVTSVDIILQTLKYVREKELKSKL